MNFKISIVTLALILIGTFSVNAQTTQTFAPSHLQAAEDLLKATGVDKQFDDVTNIMLSTLGNQIPADRKASFSEVMKKFMGKYFNWEMMKGDLSKMYASELSEIDLKEATAFYNTPSGRRITQKLPQLTQKAVVMGQKAVQDHQTELQQMMQEAFKKP